jgi:hypothetical protein
MTAGSTTSLAGGSVSTLEVGGVVEALKRLMEVI